MLIRLPPVSYTHLKEVSKPAVRIAMLGIAIGLAVMIVSVAVVIGFKHEVRDKVVGLGSDIVIPNFDSQQSYQTVPIVPTTVCSIC